MFVEATKDDKLLKMLKATEETHKISDDCRIKFVSKSGIKLKHILETKNPFKSKCHASDCKPCESAVLNKHTRSNCRKNRVCYEVRCRKCKDKGKDRIYHGETARNVYTRSREHYKAMKNQEKHSFMYKHMMKEHGDDVTNVEFDWKVLSKHQKPLQRQLAEAIQIDKKSPEVNLNSKNEFFKQSIKRIEIVKEGFKEQCEYCSRKLNNLKELENHEIDFHIKFDCKKCDYNAFGRKDLSVHMSSKHALQDNKC